MIIETKISTMCRYYDADNAVYGDPYSYAWTLIYHSPTVVEIIGVHNLPTLKQTRQLIQYFREQGIKEIIANRRGRIVTHYLDKQ